MTKEDLAMMDKRVKEDAPNDPFWLARGFEFACAYKDAQHAEEISEAAARIEELEKAIETLRASVVPVAWGLKSLSVGLVDEDETFEELAEGLLMKINPAFELLKTLKKPQPEAVCEWMETGPGRYATECLFLMDGVPGKQPSGKCRCGKPIEIKE